MALRSYPLAGCLTAVVMAAACAPPKEAPPPKVVEIQTTPSASAIQEVPEPQPHLKRLFFLRTHIRMINCGHDGRVGPLQCAYQAHGANSPVRDTQRLRIFPSDSGLVLAATSWQPSEKLQGADVVMADCRFDKQGSLQDVHFGAAANVTGYLYLGALPVGVASECTFAPYDKLPEIWSAAHLLVYHDNAKRKPPRISRTRAEAITLARRIGTELSSGKIDFSAAVTQYSEERGGKRRGGFLGRFRLKALAPEFTLVLLATKIGEHSPPFESVYGFHILERRPPS